MNGLDVFDDLRPEREQLDAVTADRVWARIVASNPGLAASNTPTAGRAAVAQISPAPRTALPQDRSTRPRQVALVGAAAAVLIGVIAIANVTGRDGTDPAPAPATQPVDGTSTATSVAPDPGAVTAVDTVDEQITSADDTTGSSIPLPPDVMRRPVAVIDADITGAAPAQRSHFDEWVEYPPHGPPRYATRSSKSDGLEVVTWDVEPENEWHKSDQSLPPVDFADDVDTRRSDVPETSAVRYVFSRGEQDRLVVTVPSGSEAELLPWLRSVASAPDVDSVQAPNGFDMLPPAYDPYTVYYPNITNPDVVVTTINFGADIDAAAWIEATHPSSTFETADPPSGLTGEAWTQTGADASTSQIVWQPSSEMIVEVSAAQPDRLSDYLAGLVLLDDASQSGAIEYADASGEPNPLPDDFDIVVSGDTTIGRFYYYAYTTADGQTCRAFRGAELGGSAGCAPQAAWNRPHDAICETGSGWDFTERTLTFALVDADQVDNVEIREYPDDEQPVTPHVETGDFETQPWALVWASFEHREPVELSQSPVTFTAGPCDQS